MHASQTVFWAWREEAWTSVYHRCKEARTAARRSGGVAATDRGHSKAQIKRGLNYPAPTSFIDS
jgi:hypothetical protein